ncbi:MAG: glycerophosphodiester phosphodiesterase [Anaerolineae bacterium]|jgi:glycerophosphoryl diester phosphodiesterase
MIATAHPTPLSDIGYPRLCAHRGLSACCPENTLPALAAAMGVGVPEIELDLWRTSDGVLAVCHDPSVDRTTDGHGAISELTWDELCALDAGAGWGDDWRGTPIPRFEQVLALLGGRAVLNLHVKETGLAGATVHQVCDLLCQKGLVEAAYIAGDEAVLAAAQSYAPEVPRACLGLQADPDAQIELALRYACQRLQFGRHVTPAQIARAHEGGLICNLFWSDDPDEARAYVQRGIDVILTNSAQRLAGGGFPNLTWR